MHKLKDLELQRLFLNDSIVDIKIQKNEDLSLLDLTTRIIELSRSDTQVNVLFEDPEDFGKFTLLRDVGEFRGNNFKNIQDYIYAFEEFPQTSSAIILDELLNQRGREWICSVQGEHGMHYTFPPEFGMSRREYVNKLKERQ